MTEIETSDDSPGRSLFEVTDGSPAVRAPVAAPESRRETSLIGRLTSDRAALTTFVVMLVVTAVVVPVWLGNQRWFNSDEWDFFTTRHLTDVPDLFRPHNEHWTTLPVVAYRLIWSVVGLRSYWPYQMLAVASHLSVVVLLRVVMRRAGVGAWIATLVAGSLLLFGRGMENIVSAFQVTFVGALALGLVQLILADHDGRIDRRDWLGLAAGAAGLMFSGVGITMVVVVGVATLLRRGWRAALFHTVPLAALYSTWWLVQQPRTASQQLGASASHIASAMAAFVGRGITAAFGGLGHFTVVGFALAIMLVVGLAVAWWPLGWRGFRRIGSPILALLVGMVAFLVLSAFGRWWGGAEYAEQSRYVYLSAAMLLPALAVAADAIGRRWRWLMPVVVVVLLIGVPLNIQRFMDDERYVGPRWDESRRTVVAAANSPLADRTPAWVEIDPRVSPGLMFGWLRRARDNGELPAIGPVDDALANQIPIRLGVAQSLGPPPRGSCQTLTGKLDLRPEEGTVYGFSGSFVAVTPLDDAGQPTSPPVKFDPSRGQRLTVLLPDLHIQIKPGTQGEPVRICE